MNAAQITRGARPDWKDRAYRGAYIGAYKMMRIYWRLVHPTTRGALVAMWHEGRVLLVRNSYVPYYSAPGGYVQRNEDPRQAAQRELREEVGLEVALDDLSLALEVTHEWEGKRDNVSIFNLDLARRPELRIDHREVVEATWQVPASVLTMNVFPPLKQVIRERALARQSAVPAPSS